VVATPGRLDDLLLREESGSYGSVSGGMLGRCGLVVLDQADRMLRLGFEAQLHSILQSIPESQARQIIISSNTWGKEVRDILPYPFTPSIPPSLYPPSPFPTPKNKSTKNSHTYFKRLAHTV
jgi:hypothetical protein